MQDLRLLPLLSSATEIVHALGLGAFQVGRSHECDFPPEVLSLTFCTRPAICVAGSSADIDRLVKQRLASSLSVYEVDSEMIKRLQPTHILTQTQCKVCAVSLEDVEAALRTECGSDIKVLALEPYALADLWRDIQTVGAFCGHPARAAELVNSLQQRMQSIVQRAQQGRKTPKVAAIEWLEPLMAGGNWVPELIQMANGLNLFGEAGGHSHGCLGSSWPLPIRISSLPCLAVLIFSARMTRCIGLPGGPSGAI